MALVTRLFLSLKERPDAHGHLDPRAPSGLGQTEIADGVEHAVLVGRRTVSLMREAPTSLTRVHMERLVCRLREELLMVL